MLLSPTYQNLREVFLGLLGGLILAIPAYIKLWLDRKKPDVENTEAEARTTLAQASVQSIIIRDGIATGEGVGKMLTSLIEAGDTIGEMTRRIFELEQDQLELKMKRLEVRRLKGLLDANNIPYAKAEKIPLPPEDDSQAAHSENVSNAN